MLIKLVNPTGGATLAARNVASIYVSEPGTASAIEFDLAVIDTAERGFATAVAVIERSGSSVGAVSVDFSMSGGDADAGVDFQGATSGTLNWANGDADSKWIEFAIIDDGSSEAAEFVELSLGNAFGASLGAKTILRINIADGTGINNSPNAVAGGSQTVSSGSMVTLNGSQSNDVDGDAISFQWIQIAGNSVALSNASSANATFTAPTVTSDALLRFSLTVTDGGGLSNTSTTSVTVRKTGGSGGGAISWMMLLVLGAILFERMLLDNRLLAVRAR